MAFVGLTFYGPHRIFFYSLAAPWYHTKIIGFFGITARMFWRKIFARVYSDMILYDIFYIPVLLFYIGMINKRGDIRAVC